MAGQAALAPQDRGTGALQGFGEIAADSCHQLVGMVGDLLALKAHWGGVDAEARQVLGVGQLPHPAAGRQQGLGGHTAPVHTGAAHIARLNDGDPQAMVGSVLGRIETAIAGTDHDHVVIEARSVKGGVAHRAALRLLKGILPRQAPACWRRRSSSSGAAATATLRDSTAGLWGMVTLWLARAWSSADTPAPSLPSSNTVGWVQSSCQ